MNILGLAFGHSAAAVLLVNGNIKFAVEEEKLSRKKGHITFPKLSIAEIFKQTSLNANLIDYVAIGCEDIGEFGTSYRALNNFFELNDIVHWIKGVFYDGIKRMFPYTFDLTNLLNQYLLEYMERQGFNKQKVVFINHHECHAASAFYISPWNNALIITNDGKGDGHCGSCYTGTDGQMVLRESIDDHNSIGQFYQTVTKFLGFKPNRHEGKITGLAAYGDKSKCFHKMLEAFSFSGGNPKNLLQNNSNILYDPLKFIHLVTKKDKIINRGYVRTLNNKRLMRFAIGYSLFLNFLRRNFSTSNREDVAAGIQELTEQVIISYVKKALKSFPNRNICLAGGVFANVRVNQLIREIEGVENIFVQPAMEDSGTALGAAISVWVDQASKIKHQTSKTNKITFTTVYLGPSFNNESIEECLNKNELKFRKVDRFHEIIAEYLYRGMVVGRFDGSLEWGPRALGNRSILVRASEKNINVELNKRLNRTEFMPFAPVVLDKEAIKLFQKYNENHIAAKYMTTTYDVNQDFYNEIAAAIHIDETARPQVLFENDNPELYKIITAYKKLSGLGAILNTSFNLHEEPIVHTPDDAVKAYCDGAVDVLSIGSYIVDSSNIINKA